MPRILESEALALAQNIDSLDDTQKPQALDILTRYKQQQDDFGEPEWPTQSRQREGEELRFRSMFEDLANVDKAAPSLVETLQYSDNPDADRARVASIAYLSRVYGKPADEIGSSLDLYRNDYTTRRGQKSTDDLGFYKLASAEVAAMQRKENAFLEGSRAALRGENVISSLQGWQGKNLDMMEDSSQFTQGFLRAQEKAGDMIPLADKLLKLLESGTGKSNSTRVFDAEAAKELDDMTAELATMKPRERKEVYASIAARVEAAGYDQKGFWSQMLGQIDQGLFRMSQTVPQGMGSVLETIGEFVGGSDVASDREDRDRRSKERGEETTAEMRLRQEKLGEVQSEIAQIISGTVDPVKTTVGWIPDYLEAGAIKGPGAVLPFMTASAALGPYGAGLVFTADFAEQNRRDLVAAGLDRDDAARIGMMAAPLQAAVESLSNAFQLGKWASPIAPGSSFLKRYVTNSIASGATEFTEEQVQENIIRPIVQDVVGMIDANVPQIGFGEMWGKMKSDTPELISVLAPMALVFGGVMTNADLQLSRDMTGNVDCLTALGYSSAQATEVIQAKDETGRIAKARELWGVRAGTKESMQSGAAKLSEKLRLLQSDASTAQAELERRGMLPRMLHAEEGNWRLTFNDGSVADFQTHNEANAARWSWAQDQLGEFHAITRETLASLEKNLDVGREIAVEFKPDARTAADAVKDGASREMIGRRIGQGKALGDVDAGTTYDEAMATDKAASIGDEFLSSLQILGSSKTEFLDGIMRTTIKLWEGSNVLTLVEEKLEGDAKAMMRTPQGRDWLLSRLRNYEQVSGDKVFRDVADEQLQNDDIVEAWSHVGQSYLVGRSTFGEPLQGKAMRRFGRFLMRAGLGGAFNSESAFFAAVAGRAQKLMEAKKAGTLPADFTEELERQLGIDSQVKHDAGALQEAASIIDTSGYSEETPGPNGETFSMSRATPADSSKVVQMPDGARLVGPTTFSVADYGINHRPSNEGPRAFDLLEGGISPSDVYQHPEWYSGMGAKVIRETMAQLRKVKGNPKAKLTIYRAGPKGEMNGGDWVSLSKEYARTHAESQDPEGFKVWQAQVAADSVRWSLDDLAEFGYFGDTVAANDSGETFSIRAHHGTPHKVDKFTTAKIGTGEGAQAYGWGLYFAENREVGEEYRDKLAQWTLLTSDGKIYDDRKELKNLNVRAVLNKNGSVDEAIARARSVIESIPGTQGAELALADIETLEKLKASGGLTKTKGNLYTVELLPDADEFLDWDKPLSEQSEKVKAALASVPLQKYDKSVHKDPRAVDIYSWADSNPYGGDTDSKASAEALLKAGIPGIRYLDGGSRGAGDGTRNYVIFDENLVKILEENGQPVANETFSLRVTPAQDAEYLAAVQAGDMAKAQRMVDEAAKAAGLVAGFHGTPRETRLAPNEFKTTGGSTLGAGAYFSEDKTQADRYDFRGDAQMYFLDVELPGFDEFNKGLTTEEIAAGKTTPLEGTGKNGGWIVQNGEVEFVVRDPSQIKSADPVTRDASGNVIPLSQRFNPERNEITFSLRSGDFASRAAAMFSPFQRTPELRMAIARVAKERAIRLGAEWIEKAAILRTSASISKEQAFREADSFDRRVTAYLDSLTPSARQELEFEPASLENDPLVAAMLDEGKLMSRITAIKNGVQNLDEYDGAPWLPPAWYSKGAGITPGKMAKALHDGPLDQGGPLAGDSAQDLWEELGQIIAATRKNKAAHREAVQAYQDAKKQAKADAKAEAEAWATQAKKQAGSPKAQREMLKAALRTLDGILSAAPPEVRAKVGGYVKLAGLATDEAMLQEIERRVAKLNVELEKWLKKEAVAEIKKLLKKGRPDSDSGKKAKGKDADMHALFAAAEAAMGMDALQVAGKLADLDARIGSGELSNDQEILAITERGLVELVGDLDNADSGRAWSALETLQDIYRGGWLKWKLAQIERRENRAGLRQALISDTGKKGIKPERDEADKVAMTMFGKGMSGLLSISSFHEVLSNAFGSKSERVTSLVDAEREASGQYEDASQNLADEVEELFSLLAGGSVLKGERLRYDMAQRTIETPKGNLSQLEAIQALLMWKQEDGQRHMEGTRNEAGEITSSWSYDQAWIDQIDAALTPEARRVMAWIVGKYGAEWQTLNPLYRERYGVNLPHHDNYAPLTVVPVQAKPGEVVDPVSGAAMSSGSILTPGSLRTRSRSAIAEPEFRDALQTLLVHSRQMEYWKAYFDLATEASAALGNRDVINSVKAKGGEESATALRKWVDALAQGGFRDASASLGMSKILSRMTGRAASVGLLGRFSTLLVQSTQLAAASVKMPVTSYLRGMSRLLTGRLGYGDAIRSEFIQRRFRSAPPIVRQALEGLGTASKPNEITRATRALGQLLSGTDALFTAGTYALLLDYHRGTGRALGLTGVELEEHAHTEAERATEQVAQPTRMATRSLAELTSTNPIAKVSWAYASEARQKIALMAWAAYKAKSEPAQFAKTAFLVFGVGGLMTQIIKNLWRDAKGDDDESKWDPARLTLRAMAAPLHGVPLASELLGDQGMLSGVQWAWPAVKDIASGEGDMRDVDTLLSVLGLFNDTAAGISSLSHTGLDAAKVVENLAE